MGEDDIKYAGNWEQEPENVTWSDASLTINRDLYNSNNNYDDNIYEFGTDTFIDPNTYGYYITQGQGNITTSLREVEIKPEKVEPFDVKEAGEGIPFPTADTPSVQSPIPLDMGRVNPLNITPEPKVEVTDKPTNGIWFNSVGYTNPKLGFRAVGLSNKNFSIINEKLGAGIAGEDLNIKTYNYEYNRDVREAMMKINPLNHSHQWKFDNAHPYDYNSSGPQQVIYENMFKPSADILMNMNNYRFVYDNPVPVFDGYYETQDRVVDGKKIKGSKNAPLIYNLRVAPALFNPLFMVQYIGITPNTPLLNNSKSNNGAYNGFVDTSDCKIKTLVAESEKSSSILGLARYRYIDFMYCKDLGKIANNHLITLRRFPFPVGDNIFEYYDNSFGDIGRLVTWFGTDDNKLEDILNFQYKASWKELSAKIDQIDSREDGASRGILGTILNSTFPAYNANYAQGHIDSGGKNLFALLGVEHAYTDDNRDILRNFDNNKVYTPKNTIQDTVTYEGKLTFTHEFTLTFCYKLRAYDNINPRSAFLDLIGNIMNVTYRRGQFWGGARKMIGPPQNISGWKKVNNMIDNIWDKGTSIIGSLFSGDFAEAKNILGSMSFKSFLGSDLYGAGQKLLGGLFGGGDGSGGVSQRLKALQDFGSEVAKKAKGVGLDKAALGALKNALGRPAMYAMDSLLKGDNVGLWHVTIGNPKNPIAVMGNLILTNAQFQTSGPLGLDDFPTEIKVICSLKHARSRDAVEIGRMFTKGTNGIYYTYIGKGTPGKSLEKEGDNTNETSNGTNKSYYNDEFDKALLEETKGVDNPNNDKSKINNYSQKDLFGNVKFSGDDNSEAETVDTKLTENMREFILHYNQKDAKDVASILSEIA